MSVCTQKES
jgi:hypothetical protein